MKNEKSFFEAMGVLFSAILLIALALFLMPIAYIGFGYLGGLVVKWIFGGLITDGLNTLFGTTRFTANQIPAIAAVLAFIGGYLKPTNTKKTKENNKS